MNSARNQLELVAYRGYANTLEWSCTRTLTIKVMSTNVKIISTHCLIYPMTCTQVHLDLVLLLCFNLHNWYCKLYNMDKLKSSED